MPIERILVVCKRPKPHPLLARLSSGASGKGHPQLRLVLRARREHERSLAVVREVIEKTSLPHCFVDLPTPVQAHPGDLVVTVGGDGTLLFASHFVTSAPILGVNSSPSTSVGVFCGSTARNFARRLGEALRGSIPRAEVARLGVLVNGRPEGPPVLNDCLIADENPAETYRYAIEVRGKRELQRGSGIWISTAAGSTGGIRSAGGRILPLRSRRIQFLAREPYAGNRPPFQLLRGVLPPGTEVRITNLAPAAYVYMDGPKVPCRLGYEDDVRIGTDAPPVTLLGLDERARRGM